ncbi:helix-turn-helix transcriptional regulator [Microlunatus flavus]|uniref:Predicted DNA-binding transcriptional regulator YafY, contains an HTH and WYL domains n=1 Tax=Microlunatus flavus TaxID=1036181 RepID=A0A1H9MU19_9ACTN|nr:WYL domain-containing protein [Microlunatus flavus]SER27158.1 Predicted DNA-binding transcriptional regulator YafY, contains an HTH and WYL domains [Microlunatus flavus]
MRADRLLRVVALLRAHGRLSAADLAARLEVSERTVLRDMEALSAAGVPVYAERGRSGGFALLPGYRPAVEDLTEAETQALLLSGAGRGPGQGAGSVQGAGLDEALRSAVRKLSVRLAPEQSLAADRVADRVVVDPGGWFGEQEELTHLAALQRAVFGDRRLRVRYQGRNDARGSLRTLDPYGLLQARGTWYLVAAHRGRPHTYRVDRVEAAEVLDEASGRPADLDLRALWAELRGRFARRPTLTVRLQVAAGHLSEVRIMLGAVGSGRPRVVAEQPTVVEVEVLSAHAATAALAGFGDLVRVLDPPEVVEHLRGSLEAARAVYAEPAV